MEYVLTTRSLSKHYGHFKAISDLSMNVPKGPEAACIVHPLPIKLWVHTLGERSDSGLVILWKRQTFVMP